MGRPEGRSALKAARFLNFASLIGSFSGLIVLLLLQVPGVSEAAQRPATVRRALLLGGGGARGAFQAGMIQGLVQDKGLDFQVIRGISVGSLNAAVLAMAQVPDRDPAGSLSNLRHQVLDLVELWSHIEGKKSIYDEPFGNKLGVALFGSNSLYSLEPLTRLLQENISVSRLQSSGRDFAVGAVCLAHGDFQNWGPEDPEFLLKLRASAAVPFAFNPSYFREGNHVLVDGSVRDLSPVSQLCEQQQVDEVYILLTSKLEMSAAPTTIQPRSWEFWESASASDILRRSIDVLTDEILMADLVGVCERMQRHDRVTSELESVAARLDSEGKSKMARHIRRSIGTIEEVTGFRTGRVLPSIRILSPSIAYPADDDPLDFGPSAIAEAMDHGRLVGRDESRWIDMGQLLQMMSTRPRRKGSAQE